ncbi:hypothetical protein ABMA27_001694 [Loxostege sticticalis]|uniref:Uncharacterized protein n=1 Tax=Loxostege sticticalis TaxID=481309 RepID=A0ABR3HZE2_LOXSC
MELLFKVSQFGIKLSYLTSLLLPLTLNGLNIYWEPPSRRSLVVHLFFNQLVEYWMRLLSEAGYLNITKSKNIIMFMVGSGLLFYMMRLEGAKPKEQKTPLLWLYTAEKVNRNLENPKKTCSHNGPCQKYILKGYGTYFGIGLAISLAKLILPRIKTPLRAISSIRGKHFKMALFFGSYIGRPMLPVSEERLRLGTVRVACWLPRWVVNGVQPQSRAGYSVGYWSYEVIFNGSLRKKGDT